MIKKVIFCITAVLLCAVLFASCSKINTDTSSTDTPSTDETSAGGKALWGDTLDVPGKVMIGEGKTHDYVNGGGACAWGSTVFYLFYSPAGVEIRYQNVNNVQESGLPLYNDALNMGSGPFDQIDRAFMLIDEKATIENKGVPVLLIATSFYQPAEDENGEPFLIYETQIGSFNTLTNEWTVLKNDLGELIMQLALYKDTILFVSFSGEDEGYSLHKMDRNGNGYVKMENEEAAMITLGYVSDGTVFFVDEKTFSLYSCGLDFSKKKRLFSEYSIDVKRVDDEFIYYEANKTKDSPSKYLARRKINDLSKTEIVLEHALGSFYENTYYYIGDESDVFYAYDFDSEKTKVIYDNRYLNTANDPETKFQKIKEIVTDSYIIFDVVYFYNESWNHLTCADLTTGAEWKIPH